MTTSISAVARCILSLLVLAAGGCALRTADPDPQDVAARIRELTGAEARITATPAVAEVPKGATLEDGLTAEEAVAIALWNNADFQVSLGDLGFARADLLEAGLLSNPVLSLLFPVGPKQLEATLRWPIEALWQRPRRVAAARIAADAAGERLVQAGLDLAAQVKTAYADVVLAQDRVRLADETAALVQRINELTQSRFEAGDISELESRAARADAARTRQDAIRARYDADVAMTRLRGLLGFSVDGPTFTLTSPAPVVTADVCGPADGLLKDALVSRPDIRAAELGIEAAAARLGWERSRILTLTALLDANGAGEEGFELGPGIDLGLPIFNRNQGARARAAAELQRATAAYSAAQHRVALELREASVQYEQARQSQSVWNTTIISPLELNVTSAERAFAGGDTSYLFVLEHTRRLTEARLREREVEADLRRARVRIERAIGRACGPERQITRGY